VQSGHLVALRGRAGGTFVAEEPPISQDAGGPMLGEQARAALDHRVIVEAGATLLAAERATDEDFDRLERFIEEMSHAEGERFEVYRRADVRFHIGLAEACHSPMVVKAMTEVQGQMTDLIQRIAHPDEVLTRSNAQHKRLITLLRRGDTPTAITVMREHCAGTEHILAALMPDA
jgi:DNA-binding FadR family transcriptional regulator